MTDDIQKNFQIINQRFRRRGLQSRSGPGSSLKATSAIRKNLNTFFSQYKIKSLVDAPCGDGNWIFKIENLPTKYLGFDIDPCNIERNRKQYKSKKFICADVLVEKLPEVDVILSRDLMIHLPNQLVAKLLLNLIKSKPKYLILSNYRNCKKNIDLLVCGMYRPINLMRAPFFLETPLMEFQESCDKKLGRNLSVWKLEQIQKKRASLSKLAHEK